MNRSKFTAEQIAYALRQVESGAAPADVCRQLGVSDATFYIWKKKYAHLGVSEPRRVRRLEEENARLKQVVAALTLDKHMLSTGQTWRACLCGSSTSLLPAYLALDRKSAFAECADGTLTVRAARRTPGRPPTKGL
jgi:putative transposase